MTNTIVDYDELIQRYCAAFDEIEYCAHKFAKGMKNIEQKENCEDYLKAIMEKAEDLITTLECIHGDVSDE